MSKSPRFWRNVTLIALAHVALIAGLIRWNAAARSAPDAESLIWLSGAQDLAVERSEGHAAAPTEISVPSAEPESLGPDEREKGQPPLTQARSEIELPKPTPMETPAPKATAKPRATPKPAPKPTPKSTPKKTMLAKATKSSAHLKSTPPKSTGDQSDSSNEKKKNAKTASAKTKSASETGGSKTGSVGKSGSAGGRSNASEFGWYGNMLHDRFYSAWIQPTTTVASGTKISTLVKVRIEKDGHVSKFEIIKPSENVVVNESVAAIAKRVTEVDSPPTGLAQGDHYEIKINFELNTNQETVK
jgi:outer membrane biosynthesis protein TonB